MPRQGAGKRYTQKFTMDVYFTDARMFVNTIYSIFMVFYQIVHKDMRGSSKEKHCYHKAPGYLLNDGIFGCQIINNLIGTKVNH